MAFKKRLRDRVLYKKPSFSHPSTTPILDAAMQAQRSAWLTRLCFVILVPAALLFWFGHPAILTGYTWNGHKHAALYYECRYLAFDGRHRIWPERIGDPCPAIIFIPFNPDLSF